MNRPESKRTTIALIFQIVAISLLLLNPYAAYSSVKDESKSGDIGDEIKVPVRLWDKDEHSKDAIARFVVTDVSVGGVSQTVTLDLGNPGDVLLIAEGCLGCQSDTDNSCPERVPSCDHHSSQYVAPCWQSHPGDVVRFDSISPVRYDNGRCPATNLKWSAGNLDGMPVCGECFASSSPHAHSRYFVMAEADVLFPHAKRNAEGDVPVRVNGHDENKGWTIASLTFGALVRTVPAKDRPWGNIGLGPSSPFLEQANISTFSFHLKHDEKVGHVIFNPPPEKYVEYLSVPYLVSHHRRHRLQQITIGSAHAHAKNSIFLIDSGDAGIHIADEDLLSHLEKLTGGWWDDDNFLVVPSFTPDTAPDIKVVLSPGISVTIQGRHWLPIKNGPTIFKKSTLNVLGLPFIMAGEDLTFDDLSLRLFIKKSEAVGFYPDGEAVSTL